jgi:hypothetical protein
MQLDRYTKLVLTVIALALVLIACKPAFESNGVAAAGRFAGVQFGVSPNGQGFWAFDTRTGDVWEYIAITDEIGHFGRLTELGQPVLRDKKK